MSAPRITIVGLGLMGGSLALALRRSSPTAHITAMTRDPADAEMARAAGAIDHIANQPADAFAAADVVVYAAPVGATCAMLAAHARWIPAQATVTDVCSVKAPVVAAAAAAGLDRRFVGGHPMCGSTVSGFAAAREDLFDGVRVWLVPCGEEAVNARVNALWRDIGADPVSLGAAEHDRIVAWVSHLPQVVSSALGGALGQQSIPRDSPGPGGRDILRLAASAPPLWTDILLHNVDEVTNALLALRERLDGFRDALDRGDAAALSTLLREGHDWSAEDA